jgi:type IV fimbrial biogenesis protein FimT
MMPGSSNTQFVGISRQAAMTAIEFLIVVAAIGLLILVTVPGSSMLIERYQLNAASNDLARGLTLARTEAISRGSTVRMCPSVDGRSCLDGGDWSHGWLVFTDGNGDGHVQEIELIEAFDGPAREIRIIGTGPVQQGASFDLSGLIGDLEANRQSDGGEFVVCYVGSSGSARTVMIDREGWVNVIPSGAGECGAAAG